MIKIVTIFSIVPDFSEIPKEDFENPLEMDVRYYSKKYNYYDEGALQTAIEFKESSVCQGKQIKMIAVGSGFKSEVILRQLYAVGYDEVYFIENTFADEFPYFAVTELLKKMQPDIILTGAISGVSDDCAVAARLSSRLCVPWYMDVMDIKLNHLSENCVDVIYETEDYICTEGVKLPVICSVKNAKTPYLKFVSIRARLAAQKKEIIYVEKSDKDNCRAQFLLNQNTADVQCRWIEGEQEEQALRLKKIISERM